MGATLRGRDATRPDPNGSYLFIRIGDISDDGALLTHDLQRIEPNEPISARSCLLPGDILFPNRGTRSTALVFHGMDTRTIVGPQFAVIRPDHTLVFPDYLAWILRSAPTQENLNALKKGTHMPVIDRSALETLPIPLPPLIQQRQIVEIASLAQQERRLAEQLLQLRAQFTNEQLIRFAQTSATPSVPFL
jgi:hypothetical protein